MKIEPALKVLSFSNWGVQVSTGLFLFISSFASLFLQAFSLIFPNNMAIQGKQRSQKSCAEGLHSG